MHEKWVLFQCRNCGATWMRQEKSPRIISQRCPDCQTRTPIPLPKGDANE